MAAVRLLDLVGPIYGKRTSARSAWLRILSDRRLFLPAALLPALVGMVMLGIVVAADPYDIRPWGAGLRLADITRYPVGDVPKQVRARTAQPTEIVLFGGSTTMQVTSQELQLAFGARSAVNLSYTLPAVEDVARVMLRIAGTPGLRRMIVGINHSQMIADRRTFPPGQTALSMLDADWYQAPDFSLDAAVATISGLRSGEYYRTSWSKVVADWSRRLRPMPPDSPLYQSLIRAHRSPIFAAAAHVPVSCDRYPFVRRMLPALREAARRGARVDLIFPPLPYQTYALWEHQPIGGEAFSPGSRVDQMVDFHACIVAAVERERLPGVTVHATDMDEAIITNLSNYRDTVHVYRPAATERMLRDIAERRFVLTRAGLPAYREQLRRGVYRYARPSHR